MQKSECFITKGRRATYLIAGPGGKAVVLHASATVSRRFMYTAAGLEALDWY